MIAPVNCCSDCDCAQRLVRCQRAAPDEIDFTGWPDHLPVPEETAAKYERWSALILDDPEWFICDEIVDNELAGALLLAAKALRSGIQP